MLNDKQIRTIADALLPTFLPQDESARELTFNFTVPPNHTFKVWYEKDRTAWIFVKSEKVQIQK